MSRRPAIVLLAALALAGCGGDDGDEALVVSAASSLQKALTACTADDDVRLSFGGSDELAAQIRKGVKPDVYAAANTKLPDELAAEGLLEQPVVFATNQLVLAVPAGSDVAGLSDLEEPGVRIAVGSESVPVGAYTREVLGRLPAAQAKRIEANIRTAEPDVKGIVGKLTQGAVDAGFVYRTDTQAAVEELRPIALPVELEPEVAYGAGVVKGGSGEAQAFVDGLRDGTCAQALREAGFGSPR